eukprot:CAMPEP_0183508292 /NCGR_PEP_ID=MMETSP0371-20130417/8747_1 /TAXON_ID=268820 /ORGANISM="Peridinium aciculiferum, Strain PAER-2" /LENGTH=710 /DNA_ID=CAMNT_0025704643 /DNA_START=81 /DNA_END=2213 /DNA_ORIENTATION=+
MARIVVASLLVLSLGAFGEAAKVTPVEKVISLLGKLQVQVEQEGKAEAAAYDKYACFCKEEVSDKQYAIEKSTAKIAKLDEKINLLGSEITALDGEIAELTKKIDGLDKDMKAALAKRDAEHKVFLAAQADMAGAIQACEGALEALKTSKDAMGGKTELNAAAMAQVKAVADTAISFEAGAAELAQLNDLLAQPGKANEYTYHANDIIATIEALGKKFTEKKNDLEQEEFDTNAAFDHRQLSMASEKKFAEKDKSEKEALAEKKREEKAATEADRAQEDSDKQSDQSFLKVLVEECEEKARLWDQRSSTRADEIKAMSEAMTALKEGVAPNWESNKKLSGLQKVQKVTQVQRVQNGAIKLPSPPSFVQVQRHGLRGSARARSAEEAQEEVAKQVQQLLASSGERLGSAVLVAASMKISVSEDHFVKVRQIIKDLVAKLVSEASSEKTQKAFCDEEMKIAITQRDREQATIEDLFAQITGKESKKVELKEDIAMLSAQIAENKKALMEATELREAESQENMKTIAEATEGKDSVQTALTVLKTFYEGAAFVQRKFVPTNSDREGNTVADKAPEVFDSEYKGSQESSKGIVGLLEVILTDFGRTVSTVTEEEGESAEAFATFKSENEADTKSKEESVAMKEDEVANIESDLVELADSKMSAEANHKQALFDLEVLHTMCVAGEETYEERVAKRQKEIEALKEAHDMLENWQS